MYQARFFATDDADWSEAIGITNDTTNQPYDDAADATFDLVVSDCGSEVLTASTDDETIERPDDNIIQWRFTAAQMSGLCAGKTYSVGLNMTTLGGTTAILVGTLAVIDGNFN
jgi:hypothetical protein